MKKMGVLLAALVLVMGNIGNSSASFFFIYQPKRPE